MAQSYSTTTPDSLGSAEGQHVSPYLGMDPVERRQKVAERLASLGPYSGASGLEVPVGPDGTPLSPSDEAASKNLVHELAALVSNGQQGLYEEAYRYLSAIDTDDLMGFINDTVRSSVHQGLREKCAPGVPTDSLTEIVGRYNKEQLLSIVRAAGIPNARKLRKAELVSMITQGFLADDGDLLRVMRSRGEKSLSDLRLLVESDGRIDFSPDVDTPEGIPTPDNPFSFLFATRSGYAVVMPREIRAALQDVDWDQELSVARAVDEAVKYLNRLISLLGVVSFASAYASYASDVENPVSEADLSIALEFEPPAGAIFLPVILFAELWLASETLLTDGGDPDYDLLERLVDARRSMAQRPLDASMREAADLTEWMEWRPSAQRLMAYLDGHVPDGADDCLFAWDMMGMAFECARRDHDGQLDFLQDLCEEGLEFDAVQMDELLALFDAYALDVPRWELNGWSRRDVAAALYASDGPVVFLDEGGQAERALSEALGLGGDSGFSDLPDLDDASTSGDAFDEEDYEAYERDAARYREENEGYLGEFDEWLSKSGLKESTIDRHVGNVAFYLNDFMQYYDAHPMADGVGMVGEFLGDWFIRKAMWSTPASIRQNAASLKKFYKCMCEKGHLKQSELDYLLQDIKQNLDEWCTLCTRYNSAPLNDDPFDDFGLLF